MGYALFFWFHRKYIAHFILIWLIIDHNRLLKRSTTNTNSLLSFFFEQNKSKEISNSKGHASASAIKSDADQTSISLSNDTESIKRQETKTQVNIVISYIEQNDEQGIGQRVNSPDKHKFFSCKVFWSLVYSFLVYFSNFYPVFEHSTILWFSMCPKW